MSRSEHEVQSAMQTVLDTIFDLFDERSTRSGQVVIHFSDGGRYQGAEVNKIHRPPRVLPAPRPARS